MIRRIETKEECLGGTLISGASGERSVEGEVIAAGPGARNDRGALVPLDLKKGDHVLFGWRSGIDIRVDGEDLVIMDEADVIGVVVDATTSRKSTT
jgi:chaperonin GroES